jgi:hypothetical protein
MTDFDCTDLRALLSAFVDDELDAATKHQAERHLVECKACRELVSEAERLNQMIALDVQSKLWPVGLPAGFEKAVLGQTVHANLKFTGSRQRWTNWLGWVAAAASLSLATSIWFLDRQGAVRNVAQNNLSPEKQLGAAPAPNPAPTPTRNTHARSFTYSGSLSPQDVPLAKLASLENEPSPDALRQTDDLLASVLPVAHRTAAGPVEELSLSPALSADDAATLAAAGNLLEMLATNRRVRRSAHAAGRHAHAAGGGRSPRGHRG